MASPDLKLTPVSGSKVNPTPPSMEKARREVTILLRCAIGTGSRKYTVQMPLTDIHFAGLFLATVLIVVLLLMRLSYMNEAFLEALRFVAGTQGSDMGIGLIPQTGRLQPGIYTITNVKYLSLATLENSNDESGVAGAHEPFLGIHVRHFHSSGSVSVCYPALVLSNILLCSGNSSSSLIECL
jgi:hypothetical protein